MKDFRIIGTGQASIQKKIEGGGTKFSNTSCAAI